VEHTGTDGADRSASRKPLDDAPGYEYGDAVSIDEDRQGQDVAGDPGE
jgi:hypothetical protein